MTDKQIVHALQLALYERFVTGGAFHIVLDDGNIRDSDIEFCIDWLDYTEYNKDMTSFESDIFRIFGKALLDIREDYRDGVLQYNYNNNTVREYLEKLNGDE